MNKCVSHNGKYSFFFIQVLWHFQQIRVLHFIVCHFGVAFESHYWTLETFQLRTRSSFHFARFESAKRKKDEASWDLRFPTPACFRSRQSLASQVKTCFVFFTRVKPPRAEKSADAVSRSGRYRGITRRQLPSLAFVDQTTFSSAFDISSLELPLLLITITE